MIQKPLQHHKSGKTGTGEGKSPPPGTPAAYAFQRRVLFPGWDETPSTEQWNDWRWQLANRFCGDNDACRLAAGGEKESLQSVTERYPFAVTPYFFSLADWRNADDPIRRQCCPDIRELVAEPSPICPDPFAESQNVSAAHLVHRFPDRALLMAATHCAVYCRHCTRKNLLPTQEEARKPEDFADALAYIRRTTSIREVLISGGDPLLASPALLDRLLGELHRIDHVEVVRIGTRIPAVLPMRLTEVMADLLSAHRPLWVNTQFNHPCELTPQAMGACERLVCRGIPVSNQAVLMRGVNDDVEVLAELCNGLQRHHVRPYYVFLCDPVTGISHLRASQETAMSLARGLRERVGGLSMPRFVADIPGAPAKQELAE